MARVLGGDQVGAGEDRQRPERDVGEIADRRRHEIEAGASGRAIKSASTSLARRHRQANSLANSLLVLPILHREARDLRLARRENVT